MLFIVWYRQIFDLFYFFFLGIWLQAAENLLNKHHELPIKRMQTNGKDKEKQRKKTAFYYQMRFLGQN